MLSRARLPSFLPIVMHESPNRATPYLPSGVTGCEEALSLLLLAAATIVYELTNLFAKK